MSKKLLVILTLTISIFAETYSIPVYYGWNLISVPVNVDDVNLDFAMTVLKIVHTEDSESWTLEHTYFDDITSASLEPGYAYWILSDENHIIEFESSETPHTELLLELSPDQPNPIGTGALPVPINHFIDAGFGETQCYSFDSETKRWFEVTSLSMGKGYYVYPEIGETGTVSPGETGEFLWRKKLSWDVEENTKQSLAVDKIGNIYVPDKGYWHTGKIHRIDPTGATLTTHEFRWDLPADKNSPTIVNGIPYYATSQAVYALDRTADNEFLWSYNFHEELYTSDDATINITSDLAVGNENTMYLAVNIFDPFSMTFFDAQLLEFTNIQTDNTHNTIDISDIYADGSGYMYNTPITYNDNKILAGTSSMDMMSGLLVNNNVFAYNTTEGSFSFNYYLEDGYEFVDYSIIPTDYGYIFEVLGETIRVIAINNDGEYLWEFNSDMTVTGSPLVTDNDGYVYFTAGRNTGTEIVHSLIVLNPDRWSGEYNLDDAYSTFDMNTDYAYSGTYSMAPIVTHIGTDKYVHLGGNGGNNYSSEDKNFAGIHILPGTCEYAYQFEAPYNYGLSSPVLSRNMLLFVGDTSNVEDATPEWDYPWLCAICAGYNFPEENGWYRQGRNNQNINSTLSFSEDFFIERSNHSKPTAEEHFDYLRKFPSIPREHSSNMKMIQTGDYMSFVDETGLQIQGTLAFALTDGKVIALEKPYEKDDYDAIVVLANGYNVYEKWYNKEQLDVD